MSESRFRCVAVWGMALIVAVGAEFLFVPLLPGGHFVHIGTNAVLDLGLGGVAVWLTRS